MTFDDEQNRLALRLASPVPSVLVAMVTVPQVMHPSTASLHDIRLFQDANMLRAVDPMQAAGPTLCGTLANNRSWEAGRPGGPSPFHPARGRHAKAVL